MYKLDLHTHSILSYDGGITLDQYEKILNTGLLNYVAITDHNKIDFALEAKNKLGERIIVGEEIMTTEGEVIGLFLNKLISPGGSIIETVKAIKSQGGFVYVPHPFDKNRHALCKENLTKITEDIDILEVFNARTLNKKYTSVATNFAKKHNLSKSAGSDAHSVIGIGRTYCLVRDVPTKENIRELLQECELVKNDASLWGLFQPKLNRLKKIWKT